MKQFRKIIFWIHLTCGVAAGIFIFLMCVTGALLSFQSNILQFVESDMRVVKAPENAPHFSVKEIIAKVLEAKPNAKPSAITVQADQNAAALVALGRDGQVFVHQYTGEITG